jgi:hypothetical protein
LAAIRALPFGALWPRFGFLAHRPPSECLFDLIENINANSKGGSAAWRACEGVKARLPAPGVRTDQGSRDAILSFLIILSLKRERFLFAARDEMQARGKKKRCDEEIVFNR